MQVRFVNNDSSILSSYVGKWVTVIVFSAIVLLAIGALFLKSNDQAHVPVVIGVCAFDSARVAPAFESLADFCRGKGCGDIRWRYMGEHGEPAGCDFYLMTSLQLSPAMMRGELGCALIASEEAAHRYSVGAVIVRPGVRRLPPGGRVIFSSPVSAAGFLSPYRALARAGYSAVEKGDSIDFAGGLQGDERVVFAVRYGAYAVGGVSQERLRSLEAVGAVRRGDVEVLLEGEAFPEIVLAVDLDLDSRARRGFVRGFSAAYSAIPPSLRAELAVLGIAGFHEPRQSDVDLIKDLSAMVPPRYARRAAPERTGLSQ